MPNDPLIPMIGVVTDVRRDTPDVKTFRVNALTGGKNFAHMPGQCAMLSIPGVGEAMFSITSSPTNTEYLEFSIKKCGCLTDWLHRLEAGAQLTIPHNAPRRRSKDSLWTCAERTLLLSSPQSRTAVPMASLSNA